MNKLNIFIRIKQINVIDKGIKKFSLIKWLKMIKNNFKKLFSEQLVSDGNTAYRIDKRIEDIIDDFCLIKKDDKIEWIKSSDLPQHCKENTAIEITQEIEK